MDPEAGKTLLRSEFPQFVVPLDCTNSMPLTKETYLQVADHQPATIVTERHWPIDRPARDWKLISFLHTSMHDL
jgi:inosine-uridine nucleoside N-ribohydrolase